MVDMRIAIVAIGVLLCCSGCICKHNDNDNTATPLPNWRQHTVIVTGLGLAPDEGTPPQKQLMAKRAAKITAIKSLVDYIKNLPVDDNSKVADYLSQHWLPGGFNIESESYGEEKGHYVMTISMQLAHVWEMISKYIH